MDSTPSDNKALIDFAERMTAADLVMLKDGGPRAAILPSGKTITSIKKLIDEYRDRPERVEGVAILATSIPSPLTSIDSRMRARPSSPSPSPPPARRAPSSRRNFMRFMITMSPAPARPSWPASCATARFTLARFRNPGGHGRRARPAKWTSAPLPNSSRTESATS